MATADEWRFRRRLRPVERLERDVVRVLDRPTNVLDFWVDLTDADELVRRRATGGSDITLTALVVKAAGLAALASPQLHRMHGIFRVMEPAHADVGISVATEEMLAPVVVIGEVDRKLAGDVARELRTKIAAAKDHDRTRAPLFARYAALVPFPLRRAFIRWWLLSPARRRRAFGTIQVSTVMRFNLDAAFTPVVVEMLLVAGGLQKQVRLGNSGAAEARLGARFQLHASHEKLNGVTGEAFARRFREVLSEPGQLVGAE